MCACISHMYYVYACVLHVCTCTLHVYYMCVHAYYTCITYVHVYCMCITCVHVYCMCIMCAHVYYVCACILHVCMCITHISHLCMCVYMCITGPQQRLVEEPMALPRDYPRQKPPPNQRLKWGTPYLEALLCMASWKGSAFPWGLHRRGSSPQNLLPQENYRALGLILLLETWL